MAIALDTSASSSASSTTSHSFSYTCTGSDLLLWVYIIFFQTSDVLSTITYNGVAMTQVGTQSSAGAGTRLYSYVLANPATGAHNVSCTWSGTDSPQFRVASYTGCKQTGIPDASLTFDDEADANGDTESVTSIADNCWHICGWGNSSCSTWNAGSGSTLRQASSCIGLFDSNGPKTPAGSYSMSVNLTAGTTKWYGVMASFAPVAASGPANVKTINGLAIASVKTKNGLAIASVKTANGLA